MPCLTDIDATMKPQTDGPNCTSKRFSILLHDHPYWHWDFLLEHGDHALCWRLLRQPCCDEPIAAERLPPHRLLYLDYEGPVSHDRGTVKLIASGTYEVMAAEPVFEVQLRSPEWTQQAKLDVVRSDRVFWHFSVQSPTSSARESAFPGNAVIDRLPATDSANHWS
jgi:hypothetical protein